MYQGKKYPISGMMNKGKTVLLLSKEACATGKTSAITEQSQSDTLLFRIGTANFFYVNRN